MLTPEGAAWVERIEQAETMAELMLVLRDAERSWPEDRRDSIEGAMIGAAFGKRTDQLREQHGSDAISNSIAAHHNAFRTTKVPLPRTPPTKGKQP